MSDFDMMGCDGQPLPTSLPRQDRSRQVLLVVAGVLIDADRRALVTQRPAGKWMAGKWEFPGGKIDAGEQPEYALLRELYEELGILTCAACLQPVTFASHDYGDTHVLMPLYAIRKWRGTPTGKEGQEMRWVTKHELANVDFVPADFPLIPFVQDVM